MQLDRYQDKDSLIHWLDPRVKTVITLLFIVSNVLLPDGAWLAFALAWGFILLLGKLAQVPVASLLKGSLIVLPFLLAAVTVIFTLPGPPLATWQLGTHTITVSQAGVERFASIVIRGWLSVQAAVLLTATTPFPDLVHALQALRVPAILVTIISFMYRYLFVLGDEAARLLQAREARSARPAGGGGGGTVWWRARVAGYMVGQLLVRSFDRSERVYNAMLSRGYDGRFLTLTPRQMQPADWLAGGVAFLWIGLLQGVGHLILS